MIELEIIKSDENIRIGKYSFHFNELSIGAELENEIIINSKNTLHCKIVNNKLEVSSKEPSLFFHINGIRTKGIKNLKVGDLITLNKTQIKVLSFSLEIDMSKKKVLNERVKELQEKGSPLLEILQEINSI